MEFVPLLNNDVYSMLAQMHVVLLTYSILYYPVSRTVTTLSIQQILNPPPKHF